MNFSKNLTKGLRSIFQVIGLTGLLLGLSWFTLTNSTAKSDITPNTLSSHSLVSLVISTSVQQLSGNFTSKTVANPVGTAFINAIPSTDGTEVNVFATGIGATNASVILNVGSGIGGGNHKRSGAMTLSGTTYLANAVGFAPQADIEDTMSITTTVGSEVMGTGEIEFLRAFVETTATEEINVDNGAFTLKFLNMNSLSTDAYVLVMSTNAPPADPPLGYQFAGKSYNIRPSGSLTQSQITMTLNLGFSEPLPNGSDPHILSIMGWDAFNQRWDVLGGNLLDNQNLLTLGIKRFTIYALATSPTWRDTFEELSLSGVSTRTNTGLGPGQTIVLNSGATSGTVTSIPITPTNATKWGTLHFNATLPLSTSLTVDVLDLNHTPVLTNVKAGADLSALSLITYPSLRLRASLTRTTAAVASPKLHDWQLSWLPKMGKVYLPVVIK